jgi:acetyl esterase/lipase
MDSKRVVPMIIAFWCLMSGVRTSAAQATPDTVLDYERGLTPTEVVDFEAMRQSVRPFKRAAIDAQLPWLPKVTGPLPLYDGDIPNSKAAPDLESRSRIYGMDFLDRVSRPSYTVYLPASARASGTAIVIIPGGAYQQLTWSLEGTRTAEALQDRGIAAVLLKYRLPSELTMLDKSIGPLQDAQQALRQIRRHAGIWGIDPHRVGVMGFSAGGHLAATLGTHFDTVLVPNPDALSVRPDFMILCYAVISAVDATKTNKNAFEALLGPNASSEQLRRFSNELWVGATTPPTLLMAAENDTSVDIEHSLHFYDALRRQGVAAKLVLFPQGEHGFIQLPQDEWRAPLWAWLASNGWMKPQ